MVTMNVINLSDSEHSDERNSRIMKVVTVDGMMKVGLDLHFTQERIDRVKKKETNVDRFRIKYGVEPNTACCIFEDLQKTDACLDNGVPSRMKGDDLSLKFFLIAMYYLRKYPTYDDLESTFDYSKGYISQKIWDMIVRIRALKSDKIVFSTAEDIGSDVWILGWCLYIHPKYSPSVPHRGICSDARNASKWIFRRTKCFHVDYQEAERTSS